MESKDFVPLQHRPHILHMEVKILIKQQNVINVRRAYLISDLQDRPLYTTEKQLAHLSVQRDTDEVLVLCFTSSAEVMCASLLDELNVFFAQLPGWGGTKGPAGTLPISHTKGRCVKIPEKD